MIRSTLNEREQSQSLTDNGLLAPTPEYFLRVLLYRKRHGISHHQLFFTFARKRLRNFCTFGATTHMQ